MADDLCMFFYDGMGIIGEKLVDYPYLRAQILFSPECFITRLLKGTKKPPIYHELSARE